MRQAAWVDKLENEIFETKKRTQQDAEDTMAQESAEAAANNRTAILFFTLTQARHAGSAARGHAQAKPSRACGRRWAGCMPSARLACCLYLCLKSVQRLVRRSTPPPPGEPPAHQLVAARTCAQSFRVKNHSHNDTR